jgi:hypothetical protein
VVGTEFGGRAGQVEGGVDDFDGELTYVFDDFARDAGAVEQLGALCRSGDVRIRIDSIRGERESQNPHP